MSENVTSEILLFLTSTAKPLYRRDLLNVCTEPEGSHIRFAYDKKWITDAAKNRIKKNANVLIVYWEVNSGHLKYYPVRFAEVITTELIKDSFSVDLELKHFFAPLENKDANNKQNSQFQSYMDSISGNPGNSPEGKRKYVLSGDIPDTLLRKTDDCLSLIEYLKKLHGLKHCYFIYGLQPIILSSNNRLLDRIRKKKSEPIVSQSGNLLSPNFCFPNRKFEDEKDSYALKAGKNYRVKLLVVPGESAPKDKIPQLSIEETISTVSILGPFVKQNPFGFETEFIVHCKHSLYEELGGFFVKIQNKNEIYTSSEIFGLLKVQRDNWYIAIFILIPLSILFTWMGPDFIREVSDNALNSILCQVVCVSPLTFSYFLKILGVGLSLLAAYLLTGKIPFK